MKTVLLGERAPEVEAYLQRRRELAQDGFDEVWGGEYHVAPMAHPWHGYVASQLVTALDPFASAANLVATGPFNLGEPDDYRVPDGGYHDRLPAQLYVPTAAIVVEVLSPDDETWEKFDFYARHGVEEICVAEPTEARLRWFCLQPPPVRGDRIYAETLASLLLDVSVAEVSERIDWPN